MYEICGLAAICGVVGIHILLTSAIGPLSNTVISLLGFVWVGSGVVAFLSVANVLQREQIFGQRLEFRISRETLSITASGLPYNEYPGGQLEWHLPIQRIGSIRGDLYDMGLSIQEIGHNIHEFLNHVPKELRVALAGVLADTVKQMRG